MQKLISLFLLTVCCAAISGCAVKGPLYFPDQEQPKHQAQH
ncbi:lipoprotein LppL [Haemophilus pittmaniae HK 85]|uniref:Predicted small periplasmic lipoprotein n=2 Tax=Haemophilus pittmaniae TaxID=249188 RepID=A0A377IXV3_9PAST|nr:lipoprotein [Haemophilus pittmaniae]EGV06495.1 lipoprotein LppL [Haemophilus pittmaniae HK 85]SNV71470.1 Predicted small periplasmic lipoprotein [Haemophilus pittmaniae]STO93091.1 Predicted small periplasmic lipoprotein [Haemophilus pittmaniae]